MLIGKTNMDEFGFGTFSTNSGYRRSAQPVRRGEELRRFERRSGGGGRLLDGHVALGVSTGGSISCPASFCGVVGSHAHLRSSVHVTV